MERKTPDNGRGQVVEFRRQPTHTKFTAAWYRKRATKAGIPTFKHPVLLHGMCLRMWRGYTEVVGKSGFWRVRWFGKTLPPGVKDFAVVSLIGDLMSVELGTGFFILDAVLVKPNHYKLLRAALKDLFLTHMVPLADYIQDESDP